MIIQNEMEVETSREDIEATVDQDQNLNNEAANIEPNIETANEPNSDKKNNQVRHYMNDKRTQ